MRRKSLINISKVDWEDHSGRYPLLYNCNIYYGCQHNCRYCYRKIYYWKKNWREAEPVENAVELARKEIKRKKPGRIMFCSMTDPYQPMEAELGLAREVLKVLLDSRFLVLIMTKSDLVTRDYDIIQGHDNVEVGFTITSLNNLPEWELEASGNVRRIGALKVAHGLGIKTFVSMEPWIPGETKPIEILKALGPWVDRWIIGALNYMGVKHAFYDKVMVDLVKYVKNKGLAVKWKKELKHYLME